MLSVLIPPKGVVRCTATYNDWYVTELNRGSNACPRVRCNRQNHETFVHDESKLKEAMQPPQHGSCLRLNHPKRQHVPLKPGTGTEDLP